MRSLALLEKYFNLTFNKLARCNLVASYPPKDCAPFLNLLDAAILLNSLMFCTKLYIQTSNEKVDVLTCKKRTCKSERIFFLGEK